jgi:pimeloyl-ACP methyl ester carboxylesterase
MELLPGGFLPDQPHALIFGFHGHGSDRKQFASDPRPECAAFRTFAGQHGMIAITPDYRACTSWMGPKAEADVLQIIKIMKAKYKITQVYLCGGSMGGTSSLTFAALHPELVAGVTALNAHANHLEYENFQDAIAESFGGGKSAIPGEFKWRSAEYWPEKLTMPIAFTVGGKDTSVPPVSVLRLSEILKKLGRKILVINRPETGHDTNLEDSLAALEFMIS